MTLFIQYLINGFLVGTIYAILALGIVLIYKSTSVFNFAIGDMVLLGGFITYMFSETIGMPIALSLVLSILATFLIGFSIERLAFRKLIGQPILSAIMATLALSLILIGIMYIVWGSYEFRFPENVLPRETLKLGAFFFPLDMLCASFIIIGVFIGVELFFYFSKMGFFMRATAESHETAQATGINVARVFGFTWAIGGAIATIAGIILGDRLGLGTSHIPGIAIRAFPAILLGGLESIKGALIGGIVVGILESLAGGYIDPKLSEITPYFILLGVLFVRPEGLYGLKRIERI